MSEDANGNPNEQSHEDPVPRYSGIGGDELRNYGSDDGIYARDRFFIELGTTYRQSGTILDAGCGSADISIEIARSNPNPRFICTDYENKNIDIARKAATVAGVVDRFRFIHCSADAIPLAENAVDVAFACSVIPYCVDPIPAIHQFFRLVRPNGLVAFDVTAKEYEPPADLRDIDWVHSFHYFTREEMDEVSQIPGLVKRIETPPATVFLFRV